MKLNAWFGTSLAVIGLCSIGLIAQTSTPSQTSSSANTVTVTGCLQHAEQAGTTGTTGTTGAATPSGAERFVLTNAKKGSASTSTTTTTPPSGTSATGTSGMGTTYHLEGMASDLTAHVNQEVEITGTLESDTSGTTSTTGATGAAGAQRIHVTSVKMISSTCPSK